MWVSERSREKIVSIGETYISLPRMLFLELSLRNQVRVGYDSCFGKPGCAAGTNICSSCTGVFNLDPIILAMRQQDGPRLKFGIEVFASIIQNEDV